MRSLVVLVFAMAALVNGYGEPDPNANGHPLYPERANFNLINVVRVDPVAYKSIYMNGYSTNLANILTSAVYPAVAPLYWEPRLGASSYSHSQEMATKNYFTHNSYDGTSPWTRIATFYSCNGGLSENIAAGNTLPLSTSNQWLCDDPTGGTNCPSDGTKDSSGNPQDGHRMDIMGNYQSAGVGYAYSSTSQWGSYWTQDFGGPCAGQTSPIYSGSHYIIGSNIKFAAVFASSSPVTSAAVVISGVSTALTLESGSATQGSFAYTGTAGSGCRSYYFSFVAGGNTYRYPTTGCLVTTTEGSCTNQFDTTCGGSTSAAGATSTAAGTTSAAAGTTSAAAGTTTATTAKATSTSAAAAATSSSTAKATSTSAAPGTTTTAKATSTSAAAASSTTAKATSTSTGGSTSTTGSGPAAPQYLYQNGEQNLWHGYVNPGNTYTVSTTYSGQSCLSAALATNQAFWFKRDAAEANVWSTMSFYGAASSAVQVQVYFNGGYYVTLSFTTSWQKFTVAMSSLGNPSPIGAFTSSALIIAPQTGLTLYLYNFLLTN